MTEASVERSCPAGRTIHTIPCNAFIVGYDASDTKDKQSLKITDLANGSSSHETDSKALRAAPDIVQIIKAQQLALCQDYNSCALSDADYESRSSALQHDVAALAALDLNSGKADLPKQATVSRLEERYDVGGVPPGTVIAYAGEVAAGFEPIGWLLCDGRQISKADFPRLSKALGGSPQGDMFALPDYRGLFLRGLDTNGTMDPEGRGRKVGDFQADQFGHHSHTGLVGDGGTGAEGLYIDRTNNRQNPIAPNLRSQEAGGAETRPKNRSVNYLIKY